MNFGVVWDESPCRPRTPCKQHLITNDWKTTCTGPASKGGAIRRCWSIALLDELMAEAAKADLSYRSRYLTTVAAAAVFVVSIVSRPDIALGQSRLQAQYTISAAGISIGKSDITAQIGDAQYSASAKGQASGVLSILVKGEGTASVQGSIASGRLRPAQFTA